MIINFHLKNLAGGLPAADVHDAGRRYRGGESVERLAGTGASCLLKKWNGKPSQKGTGFEQPPQPHQHWHIDVSYLNISGTFYYLCSVLDGYSRSIAHWDLRESMTRGKRSRSFCKEPRRNIQKRSRASFPTTVRNSSRGPSKSSFAFRA